MKPTEAHVEARRNQILDAAWECFAELGYHQTPMAAIAAAAGLSTGAIYLYFESKEALMTAINERSREISRQIIAEARAATGDPMLALGAVGRTMLAVFSDPRFAESARVNVELWPEILRNEALAANLRGDLDFWKDAVTQLLSEAQAAGELRPELDPRLVALLAISAFEGLRHYRLVDPEFNEQVLLEAFRPLMSYGPEAADEMIAPVESLQEIGPPIRMPRRETAQRDKS
jgi:AcrR family transcriptional regulator